MSIKGFFASFFHYFFRGKQHYIFSVLWAFILSVVVARIYGTYFSWYLYIKGYHIHHFYTGIVLISVAALLGLFVETERARLWLARIIGVGLGLIVDEVGLLLSCTTVGLTCSYSYGDLQSFASIIFWFLMALIIVVELPHDIVVKIHSYLEKRRNR